MPFLKIKSNYTSFCILSNAERIKCSTKKAFLMKSLASSGFFKTILALSGQISRLLVGRLNSERNLESNY